MKSSPPIPTIQLPRPEKESGISMRNAILAILLASGFSALGGYQRGIEVGNRADGEDNDVIYVVTENGEGEVAEKNMSSADNGLAGFGCEGLSDSEVVELGKKIKHERGLAFRDAMVKKYCLKNEFDIAELENAALRGYVKELEMTYDEDRWILKLEDDYGNDEVVEIIERTDCLPADDAVDDCEQDTEGQIDGKNGSLNNAVII